jgi:hypothetical protein
LFWVQVFGERRHGCPGGKASYFILPLPESGGAGCDNRFNQILGRQESFVMCVLVSDGVAQTNRSHDKVTAPIRFQLNTTT